MAGVIKDKLFFFGSFEGTMERAGITRSTDAVPTAAIRAGDFSGLPVTIYDPTTGNPDGTNRQPFAGNRIPVNRINPISNRIQNLAPLPNQAGTSQGTLNNYFSSGTEKLNRYNYDFKANWNPTGSLALWVQVQPHGCRLGSKFVFGELGGPGRGGQRPEVSDVASTSPPLLPRPFSDFPVDGTIAITRMDNSGIYPGYGEDRQRNLGHPEHQ